jgi:hypothetical protein
MILWIGIAGAAILLLAFVLEQLGLVSDKSYFYDGANVLGSALLGYYAYEGRVWPFVVLEIVWALVALYYIGKRLAGPSK